MLAPKLPLYGDTLSLANTDFLDYALSLNPGLLHVYNQGHLLDLSPNSVVSTIVGVPLWMRNRRGHLLASCGAGNLNLGNPASCRATTALTILAFGNFAALESNGRVVAKRSGAAAATCDYDLFLGNTPNISLFDGVATSTLNADYRGSTSVAVSVIDGAAPSFFFDGVLEGAGGAVIDVDDDGNDLYVLAREGGADRLLNPLGAVLVYVDVALTEEQISDLHRLYREDALGVPSAPRFTVSFPPRDLNNALLYLTGSKDASSDVIDQSTSGLDSPVTGRVTEARETSSGAKGQRFHGGGEGVVTVPASALLTGHAGHTYSCLLNLHSRGEANSGRSWDISTPAALRLAFYTTAVGHRLLRRFSDGTAVWTSTTALGFGHTAHFLVRHDGVSTNVPTGLINGRPCTFAVTTGKTGTLTDDVGGILRWGNNRPHDRTMDGVIAQPKFFGGATPLTDDQARVEYLQCGTRMIELAPRRAYPVTLANKTGGRVGPWDIVSGTWSYQDDGTRRQLVTVATGECIAPSSQAYGAWYWRASKDEFSFFRVCPIMSSRLSLGVAGQNGYVVYLVNDESVRLYEYTGAGAVAVFATGAGYIVPSTEYEWFLTRAYDGYFVLWVRGGAYTSWTIVGTGTSNTHTISNFFLYRTTRPSDTIADVRFYPLGDTLDPRTEVPGLED